jgi:hypothetical protein
LLATGGIIKVCEDPGGNQQQEGKKLDSDTNSPKIQYSVITQERLAFDL